jgi:two-component system, NtrC family, nitrogen regulation sensor histidine kinase NtrY
VERKHQRLSLIASSILFLVLVLLAFWQTSLDFGELGPSGPTETVVLWAISTLVVLGVFTLGFIVFRSLLKLYIERRQNRLGSQIKTKLVAGAFVLSIVPVICLVIFSFAMLNRTLDKWFTRLPSQLLDHSYQIAQGLREIVPQKVETDARWIASLPAVQRALRRGQVEESLTAQLQRFVSGDSAHYVALLPVSGNSPLAEFSSGGPLQGPADWRLPRDLLEEPLPGAVVSDVKPDFAYAYAPVVAGGRTLGSVVVAWRVPPELVASRADIERQWNDYQTKHQDLRSYRYFYSGVLALISIFVLFVATWLALFLSKQIIVPIEALVEATGKLSSGHLEHRVQAPASDELASLVESFNQMTQQLEAKTGQLQQRNEDLGRANLELDTRRRFINAMLESITAGVISVSAKGAILKTNSALSQIFPADKVRQAENIRELFSPEDHEELRYMMKRAQRIGSASREFEMQAAGQILHVAVTVSAIGPVAVDGGPEPPRFVIVLEDTTELLRAQRSAAWDEVARRVAHEIKNPLTPIALSAERMGRLLDRLEAARDPRERQELRDRFTQCTRIIAGEVETLRTLVDEFAQFARFPQARPERADLNAVVESAVELFHGRLEGITVRAELSRPLPEAHLDPALFKRVVVNLIDNAAEAVQDCWVKEIVISTAPGLLPDTVELIVADSGPGISPQDKERLFLPYFSTKRRGTGLGLAIVNRVLGEHRATIRVEDNQPTGSRFIIDVPTADSVAVVETGVQA